MWNCYCQEHQGIVSTLLNPVADSQSSSELNPELLTDTAHHTLLSSFAFQAPDPPGFPPPSLTNHSFPFSLADIPDFKTKTQSNNFFIYPLFLGDILSRLIMALNTNYTLLTPEWSPSLKSRLTYVINQHFHLQIQRHLSCSSSPKSSHFSDGTYSLLPVTQAKDLKVTLNPSLSLIPYIQSGNPIFMIQKLSPPFTTSTNTTVLATIISFSNLSQPLKHLPL